ncbi:MAG: ImmA/IrrE family metallo-endopeptidase, partial [Desulfovibrionaceae bacterium]|nr:ImmA/IrrE family metallo-endopeptidase [Desulfovibrionaceae bacterium]
MQLPVSSANPALLRWARSTAGLSLQEAVRQAKIRGFDQGKNKKQITAEERLLSWEDGSATLTLSQLKRLAKVYQRPLVTFFLAEPPLQMAPLMDYRTSTKIVPESLEFSALKRRIYQLHRELNAIVNAWQTVPWSFVGSCKLQDGVFSTVHAIRSTLSIFPYDLAHKSSAATFRILRDKAQEAGVYIILMSDPFNYESRVNPDEYRGVAIADKLVPLIVLNNNDTYSAMLFTLVHELAHIFLGSSGVSNLDVFES